MCKGASKGQVWTRHLAPATPAFTQPSLPSHFIACLTGHLNVHWRIVLLRTLPDLGKRQGLVVLGIIAWSRLVLLRAGSWLCLCSVLAYSGKGVLAIAGLTQPHNFKFCSLGHGGCGGLVGSRVTPAGRCHRPWLLVLVLRIEKPQWALALLELAHTAIHG